MPFYEFRHSYPLTEAQMEDIARRVTRLHSDMFDAPPFFVNVNFVPYGQVPHFVAGRRVPPGSVNMCTATVRTAANRTAEHFRELCRGVERAWDEAVGVGLSQKSGGGGRGDDAGKDTRPSAKLSACVVMGGILQAYEHGIMVPQAGDDAQWFADNLGGLRARAEAGERIIADAIEQITQHPKFKAVAEAAPAAPAATNGA